jgi:hypothetical protein
VKSARQDEIRRYLILSALRDNDGPMSMSQICVKVRLLREKMNRPFTESELKPMGRGKNEPSWINAVRQASRRMLTDKRIRRARGPLVGWAITEKGLEWLEGTAWIGDSLVQGESIDQIA